MQRKASIFYEMKHARRTREGYCTSEHYHNLWFTVFTHKPEVDLPFEVKQGGVTLDNTPIYTYRYEEKLGGTTVLFSREIYTLTSHFSKNMVWLPRKWSYGGGDVFISDKRVGFDQQLVIYSGSAYEFKYIAEYYGEV